MNWNKELNMVHIFMQIEIEFKTTVWIKNLHLPNVFESGYV